MNLSIKILYRTSVRLIELQSGRKRKLEAQFSGDIVALAFTQCGRYLAVAGSGSREILLFDIQAGAEATPLIAIAVAGEPKNVILRSVSTKNGNERIEVICVFQDSDGCYIRYPIGKDTNQISSSASVCKIISNGDIMASHFGNVTGGNENEITIATGPKNAPSFTTIIIEDSNNDILDKVTLDNVTTTTKNVLTEDSPDVRENNVTIHLGPHETGGVKRPLLNSAEEEGIIIIGDKKRSKKGDEKKEELVVVDGELTLEQRLDSLSASLYEVEKSSNIMISSPLNTTDDNSNPSTNSLVVLIDQALQSGDDALLEQSLACDEISIVEATTKKLAPGRVVQLLRRLVAKFEKRPSRGLLLTRWLAAVLKFHTSFLISIPDLSMQLAGLSQMLEQRLSSYTRLASLGGRLDLLMSQINSQNFEGNNNSNSNGNSNNNGKKKDGTAAVPRQVYKEM